LVLAEAITGEPDSEAVIKNDMRILSAIEAPKEAIDIATQEIISELTDDKVFMLELIEAAGEYENVVFGTYAACAWGWKEYRLDLPGQRYLVGHDQLNWLLIDDGIQLRLIVDGTEVPPDKSNELIYVAGGANASKRASDAVNRWNKRVRVKCEQKVR